MTTRQLPVPEPEIRQQSLERLRESNRQLERVTLALDELIALVEADLRCQHRQRLAKKYPSSQQTIAQE